jgi:hypothetical protein
MIDEVIKTARNPVVFLSGGIDSVLVLSMIREIREVDCVCFRHDFTPEQWGIVENLIKLWDLEVYTWPPQHSYLVPNGSSLARVDEYSLGLLTFPVLRDIVDGDRCLLELGQQKLETYPFNYDVVFTGSKRSDSSFATGRSPFKSDVVKFGDVTFVQPLFDLNDEEVRELAKGLPLSAEWYEHGDAAHDTGNIPACSSCLLSGTDEPVYCPKAESHIPGLVWNKTAMLSEFRKKYGFGEVKEDVN